jgi:hypothetical protein
MLQAIRAALLPVLLLSAATGAQSGPRPAPDALVQAFGQGAGWIQELALPEEPLAPFEVELFAGGAVRRLALVPYDLRAPDFALLVQGADGELRALEPGPPATVRGAVEGLPGSFFAGSLSGGQLSGILRLAPGEALQGVQPATEVDPSAPRALHFVYDSASAPAQPFTCGTRGAPGGEEPAGGSGASADGGAGSLWTEIACDADFQFFQQDGSSVAQTQNDILNVLNGVDAIYNADLNIRYLVGTILVRTAEPDPYTTTNPSSLLSEFKTEWLSSQSAIKRDVAHLFTGKNLSGSTIGIAYLNGLCSSGTGYGLSQSKFTSSMTSRVALTAHELGHNWDANHCDGKPECKIMCSFIGGCAGGLTSFGPSEKAEIEAKKLVASCTSGPPPTAPPVLSSATPSSVLAASPGLIQVQGSGLDWATEVSLGGTVLSPAGFTVVADDLLFLTLDEPPAVGALPLVVKNSIGPSNALPIGFDEAFPPILLSSLWALTGVDYEWTMGGEVDDLWFLAVAVGDDTTFPLLGYPLLVNALLVGSGSLGPLGKASLTLPILPGAVGLTFFSELATIDGGTGQFHAASAVKAAFVLL